MDPESAALAGVAAAKLVELITTDGWQQAKDGVVSLVRRTQPGQAEALASDLERARIDLLVSRRAGDRAEAARLGAEWKGRLSALLAECVGEAEELEELIDGLPAAQSVWQHATAHGNAQVYQAGTSQTIIQR